MPSGRAYAVLVTGEQEAAAAFVTQVIATFRKRRHRRRLRTIGPTRLDAALADYVNEVVLPTVDELVDSIAPVPRGGYEVSVVGGAASAAAGRSTRVRGRSIGLPLVCAMLSARLNAPLPRDAAFTGELVVRGCRILPVEQLEAKLMAVSEHPRVKTLVCPDCGGDAALQAVAPRRAQQLRAAMRQFRGQVDIRTVSNLADVVRMAFTEEAVIEGALRTGFFPRRDTRHDDAELVSSAAGHFLADLDARFWRLLERQLLDGDYRGAKRTIGHFARFHRTQRCYPSGAGRRLLTMLTSFPEALLRAPKIFPLLEPRRLADIQQFAQTDEYDDVQDLMAAVTGSLPKPSRKEHAGEPANASCLSADSAGVDAIFRELSSDTLARRFGIPVDEARASYCIPLITVESPEAVQDACSRYYLFMLRRLGNEPAPLNDHYRAQALALMERAFAKDGGIRGAAVEGMHGVRGGLRFVLDMLSDAYKHELISEHVRCVCRTAVESRPWVERLAIAQALYDRLRPDLPEDLQFTDPAELVNELPQILHSYVQAGDLWRRNVRHVTLGGYHDE